jgi:FkbH-like protein
MNDPSALDRAAWQPTLFAERLNRFALLKLRAAPYKDAPVLSVLRNHAFEPVASALPAFLRFADTPISLRLGEYDDSLTLPEEAAAAHLIWLDFTRYPKLSAAELEAWLLDRLTALRAASPGPILVANSPENDDRAARLNAALATWAQATPGGSVLRLDTLAEREGPSFFDEPRAAVTGTRLSDAAALEAARRLGLEVLPGFFARPIKAIAVDLDNTLYEGVLGEDGVAGVRLTEGHLSLQRRLAAWADQGVLLSVVSRNTREDVDQLFAGRDDFPLTAAHIADWQVGWGGKAEALRATAAAFNIGADSLLFLDDNLGELIEVTSAEPGVRLLYAGGPAAETAAALALYPGLPRGAAAFAGRAADIAANTARRALSTADPASYLASLQAVLTFTLSPLEDRARLVELSNKTNQFNLSLSRLTEVAVNEALSTPGRGVVHVRLADRLADSGSVAALFFRRQDDYLVVEELVISCRALGRKLEDLMVTEALRRALSELPAGKVRFNHVTGPRNVPARAWLAAFTGQPLDEQGVAELPLPLKPPGQDVAVIWTN